MLKNETFWGILNPMCYYPCGKFRTTFFRNNTFTLFYISFLLLKSPGALLCWLQFSSHLDFRAVEKSSPQRNMIIERTINGTVRVHVLCRYLVLLWFDLKIWFPTALEKIGNARRAYRMKGTSFFRFLGIHFDLVSHFSFWNVSVKFNL